MIRDVVKEDSHYISEIYNYYIEHTANTFEEDLVSALDISLRIEKVQSSGLPWVVAFNGSSMIGYAYANIWNERSAYRFSVESSVYLSEDAQGKGVGTKLYSCLFSKLKELGTRNVIAGITLPNPASVSLHEKMGMIKVAHFNDVGFKFEKWHDVGYWQLSVNP